MNIHNTHQINLMLLIWLFAGLILQPIAGVSQNAGLIEDDENTRFNHVISGTATFLPEGVPFEGLKISFSNVGETTVGADGTYSMEVPRHWSGMATPYLCGAGGYTFNPPEIEYIDVRFDFSDQDYEGEATAIYTISGKFTDKATGDPIANTEIKFNLTGINQSDEMYIITNEFGEYSFEKMPCWGDTLDPYLSGYYYFEPVKRGYSEVVSDQLNQDYEVIDYEYPVPADWETFNTGSFAFIAIENTSGPDICGAALEIGDLLGVFYTDDNGDLKCGGFTRWQDETNSFISAFGDDNTTNEKDGFSGGEPYTWMIYSYALQQSYPASVEVVSGNNVFWGLGLTKIGLIDGLHNNQLLINQGWSGISSYTMPDIFPALITNITDPISDELVIIQDLQKMYYPAAGTNTLILWKYRQGYKIKLNADAVLPMNGCPEGDRTVDLSTTWNIMPVLSECPVPTADLFAPVVDKIMLVKEIGGTKIYWPEMNIQSLYMLHPGKAYLVAVSQNTTVEFADCNGTVKSSNQPVDFNNSTTWADPVPTGSSHIFAIKQEALSGFQPGDFIGAFNKNGICTGIVNVIDAANLSLSVFADDPSTAHTDGMISGETVKFMHFEAQSGESYEIEPEFDPASPVPNGFFADNGISIIRGFKSTNGIFEGASPNVCLSPNPAQDYVAFTLNPTEIVNIAISDFNGRNLFQQDVKGDFTLDLSAWDAGIYFVMIKTSSALSVEKLIIN
jgi:hypothetical protein